MRFSCLDVQTHSHLRGTGVQVTTLGNIGQTLSVSCQVKPLHSLPSMKRGGYYDSAHTWGGECDIHGLVLRGSWRLHGSSITGMAEIPPSRPENLWTTLEISSPFPAAKSVENPPTRPWDDQRHGSWFRLEVRYGEDEIGRLVRAPQQASAHLLWQGNVRRHGDEPEKATLGHYRDHRYPCLYRGVEGYLTRGLVRPFNMLWHITIRRDIPEDLIVFDRLIDVAEMALLLRPSCNVALLCHLPNVEESLGQWTNGT